MSVSRHGYCPSERAPGGLEDIERRPETCDPPFTAPGWPKQLPTEREMSPGSCCRRVCLQWSSALHPAWDTIHSGARSWHETKTPGAAAPTKMLIPLAYIPGRESKATVSRRPGSCSLVGWWGPDPGQADTRRGSAWSPPAEGCSGAGGPGPPCHLHNSPPPRASSARAPQREPLPLSPTSPRLGLPMAPSSRPGAAPLPVRRARTC